MTRTAADQPEPLLTLADCLALTELSAARVLHDGGGSGLDSSARAVHWISVIEWPVEDFVSPGDLVLTTGMGCDEPRLTDLVREVAAAGAAGLCMSVGPGAIHESIPPSMIAAAAEADLGIIELPWQVRFSDVSRAIIQALYGKEYGARPPAGGLPAEFTRALLGKPGGIAGVAEALEAVIAAPVMVLDSSLTVIGSGKLGSAWLADSAGLLLAGLPELAETSRLADYAGTVAGVFGPDPQTVLLAAPAVVHDGVLGWVVAAPSDHDQSSIAVEHAATAVAIELLRRFAEEEAEARARETFLWELADGTIESAQEIATRSTLLGLNPAAEFTITIGLVDLSDGAEAPPAAPRTLARQLAARFTHPGSLIARRGHEILVCLHVLDLPAAAFAKGLAGEPGPRLSWGVASGIHPFSGFASASAQARTALEVGRSISGPGSVARADQLGSFMLLHRLTSDAAAMRIVDESLLPLENADRSKKSQMMHTLAVFLEENGNISSAARVLHLNRHSLIYRLRRIEELTGCTLSSHDDRLLLTMCLAVRRLQSIGRRST